MAGGSKGFARSTDHRHARTESCSGERCGSGGATNERKRGIAADAGGRRTAWSGAAFVARYRFAVGRAETTERIATADDSMGICELDRARSIAPSEAADHAREARRSASGR